MKRCYAHRKDIRKGTVVVCDSGFSCLSPNEMKPVYFDTEGEPFVNCTGGRHYLNEHRDARGFLTGFFLGRPQ